MSMTQVAILKESDIPTISKIEHDIQNLGFDFKIITNSNSLIGEDGLTCKINGHETFFEVYIDKPSAIVNELEFVKSDLSDEDIVISFVWGADYSAGASIGLISISLIDNCNALIYYLDDEMKYTREMLLEDTPQFLNELSKITIIKNKNNDK